jgi:SAM-dependent methyltransferase
VSAPRPAGHPAQAETTLPLGTLLRLKREGVGRIPEIRSLAMKGDWRTRVLALSALGIIIREDKTAWSRSPFRHHIARRLPWLRRRFPTTGPRGSFSRGPLVNALQDRAWIVRTAAALALGECRDKAVEADLRGLLRDPYRVVRLSAAAALSVGKAALPPLHELSSDALPTPARIGDTHLTLDWLEILASAHAGVLAGWGAGPTTPRLWAEFLAGSLAHEPVDPRKAEILRYAQEKEHQHNLTKPFTPGQPEQNTRLLHSFLVVAENMNVPRSGLVLDLGGGAAWVSELLAKLGYRPVTLDIAPALLRVGRDRFRRENLEARFAGGDMASLPFASGSFDAAVVIDALHHVPEVKEVFQEVYRVLAEGGLFLLAEPGEGHSESARSRREGLEHSICEGEIHLFEAVQYGREAGFDPIRIVPHFIPFVAMRPEDLEEAIVSPSERWRIWDKDRRGSFDEFLLQSIFSHPVLVFGKGVRSLDSRMPHTLDALLEPSLFREGRKVKGTVDLVNAGDTLWLKGGEEAGSVRLGFQLMTPERRLLELDFARAELPLSLPPGGRTRIEVDLILPDEAAPYVVKLDMVDEKICWFEDVGSKPLFLAL